VTAALPVARRDGPDVTLFESKTLRDGRLMIYDRTPNGNEEFVLSTIGCRLEDCR